MERFNRTLRGYDPEEVNVFLDKVIGKVETMVSELKKKDEIIAEKNKQIESYSNLIDENKNLVWSKVKKPSPKNDEILIKIHAAALNRADLLQRKGTYPSPKGWPEWMGLEVSGVIENMGDKAKKESGRAFLF